MTTVVVYSAAGSPGVSTLAAGLAWLWPRSSLLVETEWHSTALAGRFGGLRTSGTSLLTVLNAARQSPDQAREAVWSQSVTLPEDTPARRRLLLPGLTSATTTVSLHAAWPALVDAFAHLDRAGVDTIIDGGRLGPTVPHPALTESAQALLLVERSTKQVAAARWAADQLHHTGRRVGLLTIRPPKHAGEVDYASTEVSAALSGLPVRQDLPYDPATVSWLTYRAPVPAKFERSAWARTVRSLAGSLANPHSSKGLTRAAP